MNYFLLCLVVAAIAVFSAAKHMQCKVECSRKQKFEDLGFNIAMESLQVDVGECQTTLLNTTGCKLKSGSTQHNCIKQCIPRAHEIKDYNNRSGPLKVAVIRSCYPTRHHCLETCELKPQVLYLFPNTKYQSRVDIKKCAGQCNDSNNSCVPTKTRTHSVEGPNGPVTLNLIEECKCQFAVCYRRDYYKSFWNYSYCDNSTYVREEKVINIGQCIGDCSGVQLPGRCYPSQTNCLLYIPGGPSKCIPTMHSTESYTNEKMETRPVHVITKCGCGSG